MLCFAVISLQAAQAQRRAVGADGTRQAHRIVDAGHAAAPLTHIKFNVNVYADLLCLSGLTQLFHLQWMIDANADRAVPSELRDPRHFAGADDLIADQYVGDTGCRKHLGFGNLLTANTNGAGGNLLLGDGNRLVRLGVGAQAQTAVAHRPRHGLQVVLKRRNVKQ